MIKGYIDGRDCDRRITGSALWQVRYEYKLRVFNSGNDVAGHTYLQFPPIVIPPKL